MVGEIPVPNCTFTLSRITYAASPGQNLTPAEVNALPAGTTVFMGVWGAVSCPTPSTGKFIASATTPDGKAWSFTLDAGPILAALAAGISPSQIEVLSLPFTTAGPNTIPSEFNPLPVPPPTSTPIPTPSSSPPPQGSGSANCNPPSNPLDFGGWVRYLVCVLKAIWTDLVNTLNAAWASILRAIWAALPTWLRADIRLVDTWIIGFVKLLTHPQEWWGDAIHAATVAEKDVTPALTTAANDLLSWIKTATTDLQTQANDKNSALGAFMNVLVALGEPFLAQVLEPTTVDEVENLITTLDKDTTAAFLALGVVTLVTELLPTENLTGFANLASDYMKSRGMFELFSETITPYIQQNIHKNLGYALNKKYQNTIPAQQELELLRNLDLMSDDTFTDQGSKVTGLTPEQLTTLRTARFEVPNYNDIIVWNTRHPDRQIDPAEIQSVLGINWSKYGEILKERSYVAPSFIASRTLAGLGLLKPSDIKVLVTQQRYRPDKLPGQTLSDQELMTAYFTQIATPKLEAGQLKATEALYFEGKVTAQQLQDAAQQVYTDPKQLTIYMNTAALILEHKNLTPKPSAEQKQQITLARQELKTMEALWLVGQASLDQLAQAAQKVYPNHTDLTTFIQTAQNALHLKNAKAQTPTKPKHFGYNEIIKFTEKGIDVTGFMDADLTAEGWDDARKLAIEQFIVQTLQGKGVKFDTSNIPAEVLGNG